MTRPYLPAPERAVAGGWLRFRWTVTDPATWRDLAWLAPGAIVGFTLGTIGVLVPLYGLAGLTLMPLWIWLGTGWYGYGVVWSIDTWPAALLCVPQGAVFLAAGLWIAPWLRRVDARFARLFLAPTRNAELRLRVTQLTVTRSDTVDAQAAELRRIERDLHDGVQARLVSLSMMIGLADRLIDRHPAKAHKQLDEARESSRTALVELRHLIRGIHPPVLAERGLGGAVHALALSLPVPITVDIDLPGRPDTPVESAAYFAIAETLTNMIRHSRARTGSVSVRHADGVLTMVVTDDGTGGADSTAGTGLRGIERRLAAFDGTIALSSPPGGPTVVTMEVPCALSSPRSMPSSGTDLTRLLQAFDFDVVAAVDTGPALLPALITHRPEVAVIDVRLPPTFTDEGLQAAIAARAQVPGLPVLMVSQHVEPSTHANYSAPRTAGWATCSRTGCPTSTSSSTPSAESPPAAPPWTPK